MSAFFGQASVIRARDLKRDYGGKLYSGTLTKGDGSGTVAYSNLYPWPGTEVTALGGNGEAHANGRITVYRIGETSGPRPEDKLEISGSSIDYLIVAVNTRLNADESTNYAVYDCDVSYAV